MTQLPQHTYGWIPDRPDFRDQTFSVQGLLTLNVPRILDLSVKLPPVWNQSYTNSCTSHAIAAAILYSQVRQGIPITNPSRMFIYFNERLLEGRTGIDGGASLRNGMKVINSQGYASEDVWPFNIKKINTTPSAVAYLSGRRHKVLSYQAVIHTENFVKKTLAAGFPIVLGVSVFESFESLAVMQTGIIPMPDKSEGFIGGHAILIVGYDDTKKLFKFRNSWGTTWGDKGYGYLPYEYILNPGLASDFWAVNQVV